MKNPILILLSAFGLALAGCGDGKGDFDATGSFEATEVIVSAESAGRIVSLDVAEGDSLTAGRVVGVIDTIQLYLSKMQLLNSMRSVETTRPDIRKQIASIEEQIAKQQIEKARVESLLKANAATQKQLDDTESQLSVLRKQFAAQESTLAKNAGSIDAQSSALAVQIAQIDDKLRKSYIVSPISGTVLAKYAEAGELASAGRPLFKVADTYNVFLRAYVTSGQLANLKLGDKVRVFSDFGGGKRREYEGRITWISGKSEFTPKGIQTKDDRENLVYAVKAAVRNDGYIKIGMYGELKFK